MSQRMLQCTICGAGTGEPVYVSTDHSSLTTMLAPCAGQTEVYFCVRCGHLQTRQIVDVHEFYSQVYAILADSEEEDQLYKIIDGRKVFQTEHRVNTLFEKVSIPQNGNLLDVGCAKGLILKEVFRRRPDVKPHCFEVPDRYIHYWQTFAKPDQWCVGSFPAHWQQRFDVVTSFYVLEHVEQPVTTIRQQVELLKPGGMLYFVVPNVYANTADFVVADHLQHYSENSLICLLEDCGLDVVDVDDAVHESAFVVVGRKVAGSISIHKPKRPIAELQQQVHQMSEFWSGLSGRIREFERRVKDDRACIYGAGFYGNFIASCLTNQDNIACFVDQNEYVRRKPMHGKPVIAPNDLNSQITTMYVGLNPVRAREIIGGIEPWQHRRFDCFYV